MSQTSEDQLLEQLARLSAERESENTKAEAAAEADPRLAAAAEPLDAAARARITESLRRIVPEAGFTEDPKPAVTRPGTFHRFALPLAAMLIFSLSLLLYRALAPTPGLPPYSSTVSGATQSERGQEARLEASDHPFLITPGNRLEVVLTPGEPYTGALAARAYVAAGEGEAWRPVPASLLRLSPQGALKLDAVLGSEIPVLGPSQRLLIVVGHPDRLPAPAEALGGEGPGWRRFLLRLEIGEPP